MACLHPFTVVLLLLGVHTLAVPQKCIADADCPEKMFCFDESCLECFDCGILYRQPSFTCAKTVFDCGRCIPGYKEVLVTSSSRVPKSCEKQVGTCSADSDCGTGNFCYQESSCLPCVDCSTFHRQPSVSGVCAKQIGDCSFCLPGYENVPVTDGSRPKPCQLEKDVPLLSQRTEVHVNVSAISLMGAVATVVIITLCVYLVYRSRSSKQACPDGTSPPPYVDAEAASLPRYADTESTSGANNETTVCGFHKEGPDDSDCQARIFRLPNYVTREQPRDQVDNADEETRQSPWQPASDSDGRTEESRPLTFSRQLPSSSGSLSPTEMVNCNGEETYEPSSKRRK